MGQDVLPRDVVDRQHRAYNSRDLDAYCALYARDAIISTLNCGTEHARGIDAVRLYYAKRFENSPNLHYDVISRIELGRFVLDHERVTGIGVGSLEVVAIYEVRDFLIRSVCFIRA